MNTVANRAKYSLQTKRKSLSFARCLVQHRKYADAARVLRKAGWSVEATTELVWCRRLEIVR